MKIQEISVGEHALPLARLFRTALRTADVMREAVVRVTADDGRTGWGAAPPTAVLTGETTGSILCAVREYIAPALTGRDVEDMDGLQRALHGSIHQNTSAKAAVDMALWDLFGQRFGAPLYQLLGGAKTELETDLTISAGSVDEMAANSVDAVRRGWRILKIKAGLDSASDIERISAIRKAVGPGPRLRVDANQGWNRRQAVSIISALEDKGLDIELVEQPVAAHDLEGMRMVTQQVHTPILADESVFSAGDALRIIQTGAADLLNIKLMKTGGIGKALQICSVAEMYGVECMMGCMLESRLSVAAAAHLAASRGVIALCDLDGPALCAADPYEGGPVFDGPAIRMDGGPGIGVRFPGFTPEDKC